MTIALRWGDPVRLPDNPSGFIYFDAITSLNKDYKGQVTKHPVDGGGNVTDHFIKENTTYSLSGVVSGADLSATPSLLRDLDDYRPNNANTQPQAVSVNSGTPELLKFLPDSIGQFLSVGSSEVQLDQGTLRLDWTDAVERQLIHIMEGIKFNEKTSRFDSFIQTVEIYEYEGLVLSRITPNLVMTSFRAREDVSTGDGLYFDITLEEVTFATLERTTLPQDVQDAFKKKAQGTSKKGNADSTEKEISEDDPAAPKRSTLKKRFEGDGE